MVVWFVNANTALWFLFHKKFWPKSKKLLTTKLPSKTWSLIWKTIRTLAILVSMKRWEPLLKKNASKNFKTCSPQPKFKRETRTIIWTILKLKWKKPLKNKLKLLKSNSMKNWKPVAMNILKKCLKMPLVTTIWVCKKKKSNVSFRSLKPLFLKNIKVRLMKSRKTIMIMLKKLTSIFRGCFSK